MKQIILTALMLSASVLASANHPDSVWVRPDVKNGTRDMQIAYSIDKKHWTHVPCNLFESDYGTWGSEKKLYYPVLSYDGKTYRTVFIPNLKNNQIAITESEDFALWTPQDYPYVAKSEFQKIVPTQERATQTNVIRVPYSAIQNLLTKKMRADRNGAWERDNFIASGANIANRNEPIEATLTVNWDDRKAISPDLMGIFFEDISYAADGGLYAELIQNRDFEYTADDHRGRRLGDSKARAPRGLSKRRRPSTRTMSTTPHSRPLSPVPASSTKVGTASPSRRARNTTSPFSLEVPVPSS